EACDPGILERFAFHDVAPVAGRVADREQDGFVLGSGAGEGFLAPGGPVDRVVRVLEKVGTGLVNQASSGRHPGMVSASFQRRNGPQVVRRATLTTGRRRPT